MLTGCSFYAYEHVVENRLENDWEILSAAGQCIRNGDTEDVFYITGKNYVPEGTVLRSFYGDSLEYSCSLEHAENVCGDEFRTVRFAVHWKENVDFNENEESDSSGQLPTGSAQDMRYWRKGERIEREIDGNRFTFRCIDQNYHSAGDARQTGALFLCEQVIPWDYGAGYIYEKQEDGSYGYVYHAGPIEYFGENEEYKYSAIRRYLQKVSEEWEQKGYQMRLVSTGQNVSYTGQTGALSFEQFQTGLLIPHLGGYQQMSDSVFLLSVDEAIQYRGELWNFPDKDWSKPAASRYWLRTAYGKADGQNTGQAYAVDLINGCIFPMNVWDACGIRPAFVLTQKE